MANVKNAQSKKTCHDCGKEIKIEGKDIKNGVSLIYEQNNDKISVYKCKACFKKNPSLKNYQQCEVYSRIVGYIRPVQQWHKGKQQEFGERKEFKCC
jgi:anaerobic ribonucleoside-triphosphate reductase